MLVISGEQSYIPEAHIYNSDGHRIDSTNSLKMLGFISPVAQMYILI